MLNQERAAVEQEKNRVQMLLQGMHNVMTAYNASGNLPAPAPAVKSAVVAVPKPTLGYKSQPGTTFAPTLVVFFLNICAGSMLDIYSSWRILLVL